MYLLLLIIYFYLINYLLKKILSIAFYRFMKEKYPLVRKLHYQKPSFLSCYRSNNHFQYLVSRSYRDAPKSTRRSNTDEEEPERNNRLHWLTSRTTCQACAARIWAIVNTWISTRHANSHIWLRADRLGSHFLSTVKYFIYVHARTRCECSIRALRITTWYFVILRLVPLS